MRDLLVRYLMGELNSQEAEQLEATLRDSPEMRRELEYLRSCMLSGCDDEDLDRPPTDDAPTGLSERTLGRICGDDRCEKVERTPAEVAAAYDRPAGTPSWSLADLTVAGGVFLAISMLFLPALRQSRDAARRTDCANNQRQLGVMLIHHSETKGNFLLTPAHNENAGIFAVYLVDEGYASAGEIARLLVCRSSPFAEKLACKQVKIRLPSLSQLEAATAKERAFWNKMMSPCYAARMGFIENGRYCAIRNEGSPLSAMLADAPSESLHYLMSANHGGCGQNVLYQDGHVRYLKQSTLAAFHPDALFLNNAGEEAAGLDRNDTVLGRSDATPGRMGLPLTP